MPDYAEFRANAEACEALGRMTLALIRLESNLKTYLALHDVDVPVKSATLDRLARSLRRRGLISDGGVASLKGVRTQRDYLTRNLFDLLCFGAGDDDASCNESEGVSVLAQRARLLEENLNRLTALVEERLGQLRSGAAPKDTPLFET